MSKVLLLYIPVLHRGYLDLLSNYGDKTDTLYLIGEEIRAKVKSPKEIRAVEPKNIQDMIKGLGYRIKVRILDSKNINKVIPKEILTTSDQLAKKIIKEYFPKAKVSYVNQFLKWDEKSVTSALPPHYDSITTNKFDIKMMKEAQNLSGNSSDWWRQVGAVIVRKGKIIVKAYNQYLPTDNNPYIDGNPRDFIKAGTLGFLATSVHAEQAAISKAARLGINLKGSYLYLNSYPCPTCAKLMGLAGIKKCFFAGGNAYLNVHEVLKAMRVKAVLVKQ